MAMSVLPLDQGVQDSTGKKGQPNERESEQPCIPRHRGSVLPRDPDSVDVSQGLELCSQPWRTAGRWFATCTPAPRRAMSVEGHSRQFDRAPATSVLPRRTDVLSTGGHVSKVPQEKMPTMVCAFRWRLEPSRQYLRCSGFDAVDSGAAFEITKVSHTFQPSSHQSGYGCALTSPHSGLASRCRFSAAARSRSACR
jgi:hypothetical protein